MEILMATGVCTLGSINLPKFIELEYNIPVFNFKKYQETVITAVRFLDNINSISRTPLPEYDIAIKEKRRIGLGNMGLGSALMMMNMKYGSKESIDFVTKLYKLKAETELIASANLGAEKGSFVLFDPEKYFNSYYWKNLNINPEIKKEVEFIGKMRNSHHAMNAPTGNTGIYAGMVSGGIEPVFMLEYIRWSIVTEAEKKILKEKGFKFINPLIGEWFETEHFKFTTRGTDQILVGSFEEVNYEIDKSRGLIKATLIEDYGYKWLKENIGLDKISKEVLSTTEELTIDDHINILTIIAHYTNMNNSKTVNVSNDYPYESFKELYLKAWKLGIKGITTYRAGTSTVVLESTKTKIEKERMSPKRPKILPADIYSITVSGEKFVVAVGLLNNKPYEIFCGHMNGLNFKFKERKGQLEKIKRGHYKLEIGEDIEIDNFSEHFKEVERTLFRMVSTSLRHGIPIKFIVDQLQKSTDNLGTLTAAATRVLKKYIKDGEELSGTMCPTCGSHNLIFKEGCITCADCGWSKC